MFLFPSVGCTSERKTWIYATLFPEIQEKEMGLLNKIALIWEFLGAGCTVCSACLHCEQSCPCREALSVGSTMQGWHPACSWHGKVRSALSRACESPENGPDHSMALHFCSVTDCSSSSAEFETARVKNFPLVKNLPLVENRVLLPSQRRL